MIRIDSIWIATEPMDMRTGTETALARVIAVFGATIEPRQVSLARYPARIGRRTRQRATSGLDTGLALAAGRRGRLDHSALAAITQNAQE